MAGKRKYPKVVGYWVYSIYVPSVNKYYIGISKQQCCQRWKKKDYKGIIIEPYLDEWDNMVKTVVKDNLTKEQALKKEDELIQSLRLKDLCLNERRSGLITKNDRNGYNKEYYENNPEYFKQYYEDNKERIKEKRRQRYKRKKLQKQQENQLTLFDIAS